MNVFATNALRIVPAAAALCLLVVACGGTETEEAGSPCDRSSQCFWPEVCVDGMCVPQTADAGADAGDSGTGADAGTDSTVPPSDAGDAGIVLQPWTSSCPDACPGGEGPGLATGVARDTVYDLAGIRFRWGQSGAADFSCPSELAEPYVLDPPAGSRPSDNAEAFDRFIGPYRDFVLDLAEITDTYLESTTHAEPVAACALDWIHKWVASGVLEGEAGAFQSRTGDFQRTRAVAALLMAYARIEQEPSLDPAKRRAVEIGLRQAASKVADFSQMQLAQDPSQTNFRLFWSGFAILATGLVLDDAALRQRGLQLYDRCLQEIGDTGLLSQELEQGQRAFWFHNYAARPAVFMAEVASRYGMNLYERQDGRLHLLVDRIAKAFEDFSTFPDHASQISNSRPSFFLEESSQQLDWMEAYYLRFAAPRLVAPLTAARAADSRLRPSRETGGDATLAFGASCFCPVD